MTKRNRGSLTQQFLSDYEFQTGDSLSLETKVYLSERKPKLAWHYFLDVLICHVVYGPAVIAYWRGTWDYALIYLAQIYGVIIN